MKANELVVGGLYKNKGLVREIIKIQGGNITYKNLTGRYKGKVRICWITTMMDWARNKWPILARKGRESRGQGSRNESSAGTDSRAKAAKCS